MPFGLHAGVGDGAERQDLRDAAGGTRISRSAVGRPARPHLCRTGSLATCASDLSCGGADLDSQPGRIDLAAAFVAWSRTRRALPDLQVSETGPERDDQPSFGLITIQGMPNRSTHMPNPLAKKVLANAMLTLPPSDNALNLRSASAASLTVSEMEKPCGLRK